MNEEKSDNDEKDPAGGKDQQAASNPAQPAQIPLLDDVVFDTALPFDVAKQKQFHQAKTSSQRPNQTAEPETNRPRPTDLFGGSPETAVSGPLTPEYNAIDMDHAASLIKGNTEQVVDNLVAEYSKEIIARLRDDLTSLLDDLDRSNPADQAAKNTSADDLKAPSEPDSEQDQQPDSDER